MKRTVLTMLSSLLTIVVCLMCLGTTIADEFSSYGSYLLKPTGKYRVGFQDHRFVNGTLVSGSYVCTGNSDLFFTNGLVATDEFGRDNQIDHCREMMARIYYPIQTKRTHYEKYYKPTIDFIQSYIRNAKISEITEDQIKEIENIKTFTANFTNQKTNIVNQKFPVLMFAPGAGLVVQQYENTISEIVSHGYIVVGINNTFVGESILFPDGRMVRKIDESSEVDLPLQFVSVFNDILFAKQLLVQNDHALSQFIPHMDLNHIGFFGHSMGSMSIIEALRRYPDFSNATLAFDPMPTAFGSLTYDPSAMIGFHSPFMWFQAAWWNNQEHRDHISMPPNVQYELFNNNYFVLMTPKKENFNYTAHLSFADHSTLQYQPALKILNQTLIRQSPKADFLQVGDGNGRKTTRMLNEYVLEFFDHYLKNKESDFLNVCRSISNDAILECGDK